MALKYAILGLLLERPQTGYELARSFDGSVGYFWQAKFQQIYGELRRLERGGLVGLELMPQRGKPTRKVYSVNPAGEAALERWLDTPSEPHPVRDEFLVRVFSLTRMPPERALARVVEYRAHHTRRLQVYQKIEARLREAGVVSGTQVQEAMLGRYLTLRRGLGYERECIRWCDGTIRLLKRRVKEAKKGFESNMEPATGADHAQKASRAAVYDRVPVHPGQRRQPGHRARARDRPR